MAAPRTTSSSVYAFGAVAVCAVFLAVIVMLAISPDTGPEVSALAPTPVVATVAPAKPKPVTRAEAAPPAPRSPEPRPVERAFPPPEPEPDRPPHDFGQIYDGDIEGVASASIARKANVLGCYEKYRAAHGDPPGRPTLRFSIDIDEQDERMGVVSAGFGNAEPGQEDFEDCLTAVFRDASFGAPIEGERATVLWPIPLSRAEKTRYNLP